MKKMILLFSHRLSETQRKNAIEKYGIEKFVYLPSELQNLWSNIDPDMKTIDEILEPIRNYLSITLNKDDIVLIHGDVGACYLMIDYVKSKECKSIYATTKRIVKEKLQLDGTLNKISNFEFRRFREYGV